MSTSVGFNSQPLLHSISYNPLNNTYNYTTYFEDDPNINLIAKSYVFYANDMDHNYYDSSNIRYNHTQSSGSVASIKLSVLGDSNPTIALTYTSYGYFTFIPIGSGYIVPTTDEFFVFGSATPVSGMPASGTGTYSGINQGFFYDYTTLRLYKTHGLTGLSVDFSNGQGTVNFSFTGIDVVTGAIALPSQNFSGTVSGSYRNMPGGSGPSRFFGTLTGPTPTFTGNFAGNYFGPNADEFGFTYMAGNNGPGIPLAWGISVGKKN